MTDERNRADTGEFVAEITDDIVLDVLWKLIVEEGERVVTAREVAEMTDFSRDGVLKRLNELHDQGNVERKKVGGRSVVWWIESEDQ